MKDCGFICAATTEEYVRLAYGLALSLKLTSKINRLSIIVSDKSHVKPEWAAVFDKVIEIPTIEGSSKFYQRSFFLEASPYRYTVALDSDMVFPCSTDKWWDMMKDRNFVMSEACNFRGQPITNRVFRQVFDDGRLLDAYSAFFFFDKSKKSKELFKTLNDMFVNWNTWRGLLPCYHSIFQPATTDVCLGMSLKLLKMDSAFMGWRPKFVHFKPELQDATSGLESRLVISPAPRYIKYQLTSIVEVERIRQVYPFHYFKKEWMSDEKLMLLEGCYNETIR